MRIQLLCGKKNVGWSLQRRRLKRWEVPACLQLSVGFCSPRGWNRAIRRSTGCRCVNKIRSFCFVTVTRRIPKFEWSRYGKRMELEVAMWIGRRQFKVGNLELEPQISLTPLRRPPGAPASGQLEVAVLSSCSPQSCRSIPRCQRLLWSRQIASL